MGGEKSYDVTVISDPLSRGRCFAESVFDCIKNDDGRKFSIGMANVEKTEFADGQYKMSVDKNLRGTNVVLIHDPNKNPSDWYTELDFLLDAVVFSSPEEVTLVFPHMLYSRQDRKTRSREGVSSRALARMVSGYAQKGMHFKGMSVDLHNIAITNLFDFPFDYLYSFPSLVNYLKENHSWMLENLVIASPDAGGMTRAEALVNRLDKEGTPAVGLAGGYKSRKGEDIRNIGVMYSSQGGEEGLEGKKVLMVDDIIDTGGTSIKTGIKLKELGVSELFTYAPFGFFTKGFDPEEIGTPKGFEIFDRVFISDIIHPLNETGIERAKIEKISLAPLFGKAVYKTIMNESLSGDNGLF
jgi:ribose-phosphate pyrophosphokinase